MRLQYVPRDHHVALNSLHLHYLEWGEPSRPWLFLLHGFASNAHTWDQQADALCERFHVVALDQRGHGDSDWARDGYDQHRYIRDFAALVDALGAQRFALVGHSMGGIHAIEYAARNLARVERLAIVDIGPDMPKAPAAMPPEVRRPPEAFASVEAVYQFMQAADPAAPADVLRHRAQHAVRQGPDSKWTWKYDRLLRSPKRPVRRIASPLVVWNMLAAITCPSLVVRGERSSVLDRAQAERMAATLPSASLVEIANAGHRVMLDNHPAFLSALEGFLTGA
ncbi:MAG: alpha/beta hydrolase [Chloroflexi bacterium]|nr:alpha/beta hydrolase [Chloroflexota bacterium]